jgi:hypothetical protein
MNPKPPCPTDPERGYAEAAAAAAAASAGEGLFGRLLAVLHALMSSTWLDWLKPPSGRGPVKVLRDVGAFDRQVAERMQVRSNYLSEFLSLIGVVMVSRSSSSSLRKPSYLGSQWELLRFVVDFCKIERMRRTLSRLLNVGSDEEVRQPLLLEALMTPQATCLCYKTGISKWF